MASDNQPSEGSTPPLPQQAAAQPAAAQVTVMNAATSPKASAEPRQIEAQAAAVAIKVSPKATAKPETVCFSDDRKKAK